MADLIPKRRYLDAAFARLEHDRMWSRAWQMACRLEEVPEVGDFAEYVIGDQSALVVRTPEGIRAYANACRHRATQLATGTGSFSGGRIVCPFHGWRWELDGTNQGVFCAHAFDPELVSAEETALTRLSVGTWAGCVWVSFDADAPPLLDALSPLPSLLDPLGVDRMRVRWWKSTRLRANWKVAQEAFMEGWHVAQTHPQLALGHPEDVEPDALEYHVHPNGHSDFVNRPRRRGIPDLDGIVESARVLCDGLDAMTLPSDVAVLESVRAAGVPEGSSFGAEFVKAWYADAAERGVELPPPDKEAMARWGGMFFAFPNFFVLPQYANALLYRSRPVGDDPEECLFEVWSVTIPPRDAPAHRPTPEGPLAADDPAAWPEIPRQDFSNIERQQRGLHSRSIEGMRLSRVYEAGIANMHAHLDTYLQ